MGKSLSEIWRESLERVERDTADAMSLPWGALGTLSGYAFSCLGVLISLLVMSPISVFITAPLGYVIGLVLVLLLQAVAWMFPMPFAWLARRIA
jgi:hypothetical protein